MQHMVLIRQNLSEQLIVLFLANLSKRNLFKQKAKMFEFVHNSLYYQDYQDPVRRLHWSRMVIEFGEKKLKAYKYPLSIPQMMAKLSALP